MGEFTITVDENFLAAALTSIMQMEGKLDDDSYLVVNGRSINEDGYLEVTVEAFGETIN